MAVAVKLGVTKAVELELAAVEIFDVPVPVPVPVPVAVLRIELALEEFAVATDEDDALVAFTPSEGDPVAMVV